MMDKSSQLTTCRTLSEFFKKEVEQAFEEQELETSEEVGFYVVNLLEVYAKTDRVVDMKEPFAMLMHRAVYASGGSQVAAYRHLGDISLYIAGFFSPSLRRRSVDVNYAIKMGAGAYATVASLVSTRKHKNSRVIPLLYRELAEKFASLVEALTQISERTPLGSDSPDIALLYERWSRTRGKHLTTRLQELGAMPGVAAGPSNSGKLWGGN